METGGETESGRTRGNKAYTSQKAVVVPTLAVSTLGAAEMPASAGAARVEERRVTRTVSARLSFIVATW